MNVFGVGPAELLVILVVALIFVGPERLPRLAADIARTIREIRRYTSSIAAEFTEVIEEFEKETAGDRGQWKEIGQGLTEATKSVSDALRGAQADAAGKSAPAAPSTAPASGPPAPATNGNAEPTPATNGHAEPAPAEGAAWVAVPEPPANGAHEADHEAPVQPR